MSWICEWKDRKKVKLYNIIFTYYEINISQSIQIWDGLLVIASIINLGNHLNIVKQNALTGNLHLWFSHVCHIYQSFWSENYTVSLKKTQWSKKKSFKQNWFFISKDWSNHIDRKKHRKKVGSRGSITIQIHSFDKGFLTSNGKQ